jgi:hypothetical protein
MRLAHDLACALDPAKVMHFAGMKPDAWQARLLRSDAGRILLLCARQSGKTSATAALAASTALFSPGALVLLLSPSLRQSQELFRTVTLMLRAVAQDCAELESMSRLELPNRSRILSLPASPDTIRGLSKVNLLVLDEAAWVEGELYFAVRPMLAVSQGRIVAMSTPNGRQGWFYEAWTNGGAHWQRIEVTAADCPRITPSFLAAERIAMPDWRFRQEYLCEFVDADSSVFMSDLVSAAICEDVTPLPLTIRWGS